MEQNDDLYGSAKLINIAPAIIEFNKRIQGIEPLTKNKNASVPGQFSYNYADLLQVVEYTLPHLTDCGLFITHSGMMDGHDSLYTRLIHTSGEYLGGKFPISIASLIELDLAPGTRPEDSSAAKRKKAMTGSYQLMGSMITYVRRFAHCAILNLVADEDDDANGPDATGAQIKNLAKSPFIKPANVIPPAPLAQEDVSFAKAVKLVDYFKAKADKAKSTAELDALSEDNKPALEKLNAHYPELYGKVFDYITDKNFKFQN